MIAATAAAEAAAAPTDPVETELAVLMALPQERPQPGLTGAQHYQWFDQLCQRIGREAFAFIEKHPDDPRRWQAALLLQMRRMQPRFVQSIGADYDTVGEKAVVRDTAAEAAWEVKVAALEKALRAATDVPDAVREQLDFGDMMAIMMPNYQAAFEDRPADVAAVEAALTTFLTRWPNSESGANLPSLYVNFRRKLGAADEMVVLAFFAEGPNGPAREYVKARARFFELSRQPFELAFTALDGRAVDLQKLRGKVVLIDFWATWCGPCIQELPNVRQVYAEYHDKGFEIIGVSLDAEKDRKKFIELAAKEGVTWPQRFEGKGWKDSLATQYTITGIPAMFLLDQEGRLVSTNARGEKLGQEVKRLLKL